MRKVAKEKNIEVRQCLALDVNYQKLQFGDNGVISATIICYGFIFPKRNWGFYLRLQKIEVNLGSEEERREGADRRTMPSGNNLVAD